MIIVLVIINIGLIIVIKPCTINSNDHRTSNIGLNIVIKPCTSDGNDHSKSNIVLNTYSNKTLYN